MYLCKKIHIMVHIGVSDDNLISDSGLFNWNSSLKKEEKQYVMDFRAEAAKDEYDTYDEEL